MSNQPPMPPEGPAGTDLSPRLSVEDLWAALGDRVALSISNADTTILRANDRFCQLMGYEREELIGKSHKMLRSGEHPDAFYQQLWETILSGQTWQGDICSRAKDGRDLWLDTTIVPEKGPDGVPTRFLSIRFETSHPRRSLGPAELMDPRQLLLRLLDSEPECVKVVDREGRIQHMNPAGLAMVGALDLDQVVGQALLDLVHPEDRARYQIGHMEAVAGAPVTLEFRMVDLKGQVHWMESTALPSKGSAGDGSVLWITRDLSRLRAAEHSQAKAEAALEESESRLQLALEAANAGLWDWNLETDAVVSNLRLFEMLGQNPGLVRRTGSSWKESIHPEDLPVVSALLEDHLEGRTPRFVADYRLRHASGEWVWIVDRGRVVARDAEGRPTRMIGLVIDRTARQREQEALQEAQRLESLGLLAGGIAHDLNNMLTAVMMQMDRLETHLGPEPAAHQDLDRLQAAATRIRDLVHEMLVYASRSKPARAMVDLNALVKDMVSLMEVAISRRAKLELDLSIGLPAVLGDAVQLHQVLLNLVTNASEAVRPPGRIDIRTRIEAPGPDLLSEAFPDQSPAAGRFVALEVEDDGCGMDAPTRARIFETFYTTKSAGRGLGLSAMLGIVRAHGGGILVRSAPGKGTCFRIYFPFPG